MDGMLKRTRTYRDLKLMRPEVSCKITQLVGNQNRLLKTQISHLILLSSDGFV